METNKLHRLSMQSEEGGDHRGKILSPERLLRTVSSLEERKYQVRLK